MTMYWEKQLKPLMERIPGVSDTYGVFVFCAARPEPGTPQDRCDYDTWGPVGPVRDDDPRYQTPFGSGVITTTNHLLIYGIPFALSPDGFIIYIEAATNDADRLRDPDAEDHLVNWEDPPCCTRTFHEMLRLLWEWAQVTVPPFGNDEVAARTAVGILNRLRDDYGLTDELLTEIIADVPPMQISQYLAGNPNARARPPVEMIPPPPQAMLDWAQAIADPLPVD